MDRGVSRRRDITVRGAVDHAIELHSHAVQTRRRHRRGTSDDALVVGRILRRLNDALAAARRASIPQREFRPTAIERADDRFRLDRHLVNRPVRVVHELLRMIHRERGTGCRMPGIGARRGISLCEGCRHGAVGDGTGPASIADRLQLLIPVRHRHPHFDLDVGVAGRRQRCRYAAECRKLPVSAAGARTRSRRHKRSGINNAGEGDPCVRQRERRQWLTRGRRRRILRGAVRFAPRRRRYKGRRPRRSDTG